MINKKTGKVALLGILGAQALALSFLENLLPSVPGLPPGLKPGLSNIITMFTASAFNWQYAMMITLLKAAFAGLTRGMTAFFMSLAGGFLSTVVMCIGLRTKKETLGFVGISVLSAISHNTGQIIIASFLTGTAAIFMYLPILMIFGTATGIVTGLVLKAVIPELNKLKRFFKI